MNNKVIIGVTQNGKVVYIDSDSTHAHTHLSDTPELLRLVKEALGSIIAEGGSVYTEIDMGRIVGKTDLVETRTGDDIVYAKRLNRNIHTRFVKNRTRANTSHVTIILHKTNDGYRLFSAWIGRKVPPFPGDEKETSESKAFWKRHALVWGQQVVQPNTEVYEWPWG